MKILQVIHQFPPERVGGTETYTLGLAKELVERGHQPAVFHRAPAGATWETKQQAGVTVYRTSTGSMSAWSVFRATFGNTSIDQAFQRTLADFGPDLIHVQHLMGLPVSLVNWAYTQDTPLVLTLHDYWFMCPNAQLLTNYDQSICHGPQRGGLNCAHCALARAGVPGLWPLAAPALLPLFIVRNHLLRRTLTQFTQIIAPSRFLADQMIKWGAPAECTHFLPNGLDTTGLQPRRSSPNNPLRFAFIGGIAPQKGVHVLIEAFNTLQAEATLEIYGDLDQFPTYARKLQKSARSQRITFGGRLDRAGVWQTLSEIDALLVPSLWYENAPVVIQEAHAAGVPVIASDLGAITEWVQHQENGLLVTAGDTEAWQATLQKVIDDEALLPGLGANTPTPMTVAKHLDRLEALYQALA